MLAVVLTQVNKSFEVINNAHDPVVNYIDVLLHHNLIIHLDLALLDCECQFGSSCLSPPKTQKSKPDLQVWILEIMTWQGFVFRDQTLDEEILISSVELSEIEDEIREIRKLLDELPF